MVPLRSRSFLSLLLLLLLCPDSALAQANTGSVFGQGNLGRGRLTWGNPPALASEINKRLATKLPTYQVFSLTAAPGTDFEGVYRGKSRQFKEQVPYWRRKLVNGRYVYDAIGKKEISEWAPILRFYANFVVHPRVSLWRKPEDRIPNVLKTARSSHKYDGRSIPWTVYKPTPDQLWTSRQLVLTPKEARARRDVTYKMVCWFSSG